MDKLKALITASFSEKGLNRLKEQMEVEYLNWLERGRPFTQAELNGLVKDKDILIVETCEIHRELIANHKKLKVIACCRGLRGDDPTIDIAASNERNIPILFAPGRNANSVAEFTVLMTLAVMRKIRPATEWLHSKQWNNWLDFYTTFRTSELRGKTVGLVGFGHIGRRVSELFKAFGANVVGYDPYIDGEVFDKYEVRKVALDRLLQDSDVVSLHMSVSQETKGMIDAEKMAMMKPTAFLINSARAALVDREALYNALKEGKIAGAALDVYHQEPTDPDREPLLRLDNVFATPHLAGTAGEVIENHTHMVVEDLGRLLKGERPEHILNPRVLPAFFAGLASGWQE